MAGLLIELLGWLGGAFPVAAYGMRTMLPLSIMAIASSVMLLSYGIATQAWPLVGTELILLPLNIWRLCQILSLQRQLVEARLTRTDDFSVLKAYSTGKDVPAGGVTFRWGDHAETLHFIADGSVRIEGAAVALSKGHIFGEIGFFTDSATRTATARVETDARIHWIEERTFLRLQFQDPAFGMAVMRTITRRLMDRSGGPPARGPVPAAGRPMRSKTPRRGTVAPACSGPSGSPRGIDRMPVPRPALGGRP